MSGRSFTTGTSSESVLLLVYALEGLPLETTPLTYLIRRVEETVNFALELPTSKGFSSSGFAKLVTRVLGRGDVQLGVILTTLSEEIHWAECTGIFTKHDIGVMERDFLKVLDYEVGVKEYDIIAHHASLMVSGLRRRGGIGNCRRQGGKLFKKQDPIRVKWPISRIRPAGVITIEIPTVFFVAFVLIFLCLFPCPGASTVPPPAPRFPPPNRCQVPRRLCLPTSKEARRMQSPKPRDCDSGEYAPRYWV
ncbi:hypothetical protein B0H11DRAFT_1924010 [Mycena galericulata]|nr:hypothetical protein B0H11DRAFT_1924010 [Mycena galericulata]